MTGRLRPSRAGLDLIKSFEGFREIAARLPDGRWTIGYGHVRTAREGLSITEADANDLLASDLRPVEDAIRQSVFTPLNQNQFDALVSLVFNISPDQFRDSAIARNLNAGDFLNAASGFDLWRKARIHGQVMVVDALVRRRAAEKAMFLEHPDGRPTASTPMVTPMSDTDGAITQSSAQASDAEPSSSVPPAGPIDDQYGRPPSIDIAEAVRRLAERTNQIATASGQRTFTIRPNEPEQAGEPEVALGDVVETEAQADVEPEAEQPVHTPPRTASEIEAARRAVADRIARILERAERAIAEEQPATAHAEPEADPVKAFVQSIADLIPQAAVQPAPKAPQIVLEGMPDFDGPATPRHTPRPNGRALIDDTETFDPGRDPAAMFAEAEVKAKIVNGRAQRLGILSGRMVNIAPWIVILVLSVLGVTIGLVDTFKEAADVSDASVRGATAVLAVFGMLLVMSVYFLVTRGRDSDPSAQ
ncbi:MAG: glycoside hydrolase family protein [Hyphomonadaceae bacterium]|nr:glycoside hydrolase family protein [Hyphomonadaceae bacterium]